MKNINETEINKLTRENKRLKEEIIELKSQKTNLYDFILGEKGNNLRELLMFAPIGMAIAKILGNILHANSYFCKMLGYSKSELQSMTIKDISYEEDYKKEVELIKQLPQLDSNTIKIEKRYYDKNGDTVWANLVFILFEDANRELYGVGFIEDITEIKQKEKELIDTETKFKSIFNGINDSVFMHAFDQDKFLNFIEVNTVACKRYGYTREEFLSLSINDIINKPEKHIELSKNFRKQLKQIGKATYERFNITKSGEIFPVEVNARLFTFNNQEVILSVVRDISIRKETENKLKESKRQLTTLIDNLPGIAYRCKNDAFWTMEFISDALEDITGHSVESLINNKRLSYNELIYPDDRENVKNSIESAIVNKRPFDMEYRIYTTSGNIKWVKEQGCAIYNKDGSISHLEGYISDITEIKTRETELIEAKDKAEESDKLKSSFLATMSHELRTPLNGIIGFSELLNSNTPPGQVEVFSKNILDCGNNLLAIIEDIFDLALLETDTLTLNKQTFKIFELYLYNKDFLEDFLLKSGKKENINLVYKPDNSIIDCFIEGDRFKINQVLANLIKNAVKFTHKGFIEFGFYTNNNSTITFYIKDTGIGISKESQKIIFEFFRQAEDVNTRKYGGTGIGLTISRIIANAMDGSLTVESKQGYGSTFYFTIPFITSSEILIKRKKEIVKTKNNIDFSDIKILIVEDEEINLFLLESILEVYNPILIKAENGLEALIKYHENPDINIILMDIKMPIMDGIESTAKIRELNQDVPIVALTAYNYDEEVSRIKQSGFNDYISKPFNKDNLMSKIREQLEK